MKVLLAVAVLVGGLALGVRAQAPETPELTYTAVSANVADPGQAVRIRIFRWSSDRERSPILAALDPLPPPAADDADGRGAAAGGRGGRAAGGGRGGGRGGRASNTPPPTPAALLAGAIRRAPSIGYIWTNDVTGYSIKYAWRTATPDGGERIVLATDRRLGTHTAGWQPVTEQPHNDYQFTVLELRFDAKGNGEARASLTTPVAVDKQAGTLVLENYSAAPVILQKVRAAAHGG
jgi:hypothetical protein